MARWIGTLLSIVLMWTMLMLPVNAQEKLPISVTDEQLRLGEALFQKAFEATEKGNFSQAESHWTSLIKDFPSNPAVWSNRGNSRVSQNKLAPAIEDFNQAIALAPNQPDAYLNRGAALEGQGQFEAAIADYNKVLEIDPQDPMAYNNRGNAEGSLGQWQEAIADFQKASEIAPNFAFARANTALALYEIGDKKEALKTMRDLVRKYPMFPDMRAALTAVLWSEGQQGEAESNWVAAVGMDNRYQDLDWVKTIRRWPPEMITSLDKFLNLK
jgi:tetratricopeptide (TPR) repeat protein